MTRFALQFGQTAPGLAYRERATVHGICVDAEGRVALARIGTGPFEFDLPGGGLEPTENEAAALCREFLEETGLTVEVDRLLGRAGQFWISQGDPRNSLSAFYTVRQKAPPQTPQEPDHALVWMPPEQALRAVRHEAHAWVLLRWLRAGQAGER